MQEALQEIWQREAAARASFENGTEEGLGESLENANASLSENMDVDREPVRNNIGFAARSLDSNSMCSIVFGLAEYWERI